MPKAIPIDVSRAFGQLICLDGRSPETSDEDAASAFARLSDYRDGGVFVSWFNGRSEWERHAKGDELVYAVDGRATLILLIDGAEVAHDLPAGHLIVVPGNTWHRFETPGVKLLTVTPQPTDHSAGLPE